MQRQADQAVALEFAHHDEGDRAHQHAGQRGVGVHPTPVHGGDDGRQPGHGKDRAGVDRDPVDARRTRDRHGAHYQRYHRLGDAAEYHALAFADLTVEQLLVEVAGQGEAGQHEQCRGGGHDRRHQAGQADTGQGRVGVFHEADDHGAVGGLDAGLDHLHGAGRQKHQQLHGRGEEHADHRHLEDDEVVLGRKDAGHQRRGAGKEQDPHQELGDRPAQRAVVGAPHGPETGQGLAEALHRLEAGVADQHRCDDEGDGQHGEEHHGVGVDHPVHAGQRTERQQRQGEGDDDHREGDIDDLGQHQAGADQLDDAVAEQADHHQDQCDHADPLVVKAVVEEVHHGAAVQRLQLATDEHHRDQGADPGAEGAQRRDHQRAFAVGDAGDPHQGHGAEEGGGQGADDQQRRALLTHDVEVVLVLDTACQQGRHRHVGGQYDGEDGQGHDGSLRSDEVLLWLVVSAEDEAAASSFRRRMVGRYSRSRMTPTMTTDRAVVRKALANSSSTWELMSIRYLLL